MRKYSIPMLEPWNSKSILPPPVNTYLCNKNIDIENLVYICNSIIQVLSKQSPLHKESAIFFRFVYKYDKKFRNDIGYRYFKKVNSALRKYLSLTLMRDVQNFLDLLPPKDEARYAPTRQMLEYVLIKLMTFSKLMFRISLCSKQAAIFYLDRIKRGESHWMSLMPYALLSRVWSMGLVLLQYSCNWYKELYSFLNQLELRGLNFLPDKYELPLDLEEWIDLKHLNETHRFEWSQKLAVNVDLFIDEDNEGDLCENILKYIEDINKNDESTNVEVELPKFEAIVKDKPIISNIDQGVAISRESFKLLGTNILPKVTQKHCVENITDTNSLITFIEEEETLRYEALDKSLTNHLSFMQWQTLKNSLLKLDTPLTSKKKLEKKVQKIWTEKCLDYM